MRLMIVGTLEGYITEAGRIAHQRGAKVSHTDSVERSPAFRTPSWEDANAPIWEEVNAATCAEENAATWLVVNPLSCVADSAAT